VPFAARIGPLLWSRWLPELHEGLASRFRDIVRPIDLAPWGVPLVAAAWISPSLLITPLMPVIFGVWLRRTLGGISGDGHGAGIEVCESLLLTAAAITVGLA